MASDIRCNSTSISRMEKTLLAFIEAVRPLVRVIEALRVWSEQTEVRAVLLAFNEWGTVDSRLEGYRERWSQEGVPITVKEAEYALGFLCYATFNEPVEPSEYLAHTLEDPPGDEVIAKYIECAESKSLYWDALAAHKESHDGDVSPLLAEWPPKGAKRPSGRGRPRQWIFRNEELIPEAIRKLEGCGLPVTSAAGPAIATAVAKVFGLN